MPHATKRERRVKKSTMPSLLSVYAQDLGPYPKPSPQKCTVLSSVDGGHSRGGTAGGGSAPADPAAQEELFVDRSGTAAVWRTLGGQVSHASFRSVVLGPGAHGLAGSNGQGAISQVVRCRFPTLLEGWSSKYDADTKREARGKRERWTKREKEEEKEKEKDKGQRRRRRRPHRGPWSVCILREPDLVTVHYPNGDSYDVALPCEARLLQPLGEGLLVQRFSDEAGEDLAAGVGVGGARSNGASDDPMDDGFLSFAGPGSDFSDADTPSLFSLLHPLDELRPVALLPPLKGALGIGSEEKIRNGTSPQLAAEEQHQRLVCDAGERVIFAGGCGARGMGPDSSLLLTYHAGRRRHSLWLLFPVPEPPEQRQQQPEPKAELELETMAAGPPTTAAGDVSILGPLIQKTPGNGSWRGATATSPARDASSLSSTLLGVSALDSSSSLTALSMIDSAFAGVGGGRPPRDRLSVGNASQIRGSTGRGRMSGGAGRRSSTGSNASWIGPGNTRNEALANALGLGHSALGGGHVPILARGGDGGGGCGGGRGARDESVVASLVGGVDMGGAIGALGERDTILEDDEDEDDEAQPIRPHLGLSLLWREAEDCSAAVQHAFCAAAGTPGEGGRGIAVGAAPGPCSEREFLVCLVNEQSERLRALSISVNDKTVALADGDISRLNNGSIVVAEAFTTPCRAAVGVCATAGAEGEGFPGGAIAPDILVLTPDRRLILQRGDTPVTGVTIPAPVPLTAMAGRQNEEDQIDWLSDAVGSCFTLETRAGERRRVRLSLDPASPLVAACLGAWDCLLTPALAASLRADVMGVAQKSANGNYIGVAEGSHGHRVEGIGSNSVEANRRQRHTCSVGEDLDWIALVSVLRDLVLGGEPAAVEENRSVSAKSHGGEGRTNGRNCGSDGSQGIGSSSSSAWTAFLSSPSHNQYARDSVMLLSGLRIPDRQNSCSESARPTATEPFKPPPPPRPGLQTQRAAFRAEIGAALDALHLVLEDMKISRLTTSLVPRLASLLLSLARACGRKGEGMRDFADHYWRDAAGCGDGRGEVASMISVADGSDGARGWLPSRPTRFCKVRLSRCERFSCSSGLHHTRACFIRHLF